jgi:serine/threonine protein kinase
MIFINQDAVKLDELFLNQEWTLTELYERIYSVEITGHTLNWIVKTYDRKKYAEREYRNLIKMKDIEGVPQVLAVNFAGNFNYIILSRAPGRDLLEYTPLNEADIFIIARQLVQILKNVHFLGIIHKDIKLDNIIFDPETKKVTLIDFEGKETPDYRSPEQINGTKLTSKTDMWSLGVVLWILYTGELPFRGRKEILTKKLKYPKMSKKLRELLEYLLERDVDLRYDAEDTLEFLG